MASCGRGRAETRPRRAGTAGKRLPRRTAKTKAPSDARGFQNTERRLSIKS